MKIPQLNPVEAARLVGHRLGQTDPDDLRCGFCHCRFYSWAEVAQHELEHHKARRTALAKGGDQ